MHLSQGEEDGAQAVVDRLGVCGGQLCEQVLHQRSLRPLQASLQLRQPRQPHIQRHLHFHTISNDSVLCTIAQVPYGSSSLHI